MDIHSGIIIKCKQQLYPEPGPLLTFSPIRLFTVPVLPITSPSLSPRLLNHEIIAAGISRLSFIAYLVPAAVFFYYRDCSLVGKCEENTVIDAGAVSDIQSLFACLR